MTRQTNRPTAARRVALCAVLCAVSLLFSYLETFVPMPVPGMKIGLANLIPLLLLTTVGIPDAACVSLLRISLAALLFGSPFSFLYSLAGGVVSFAVTVVAFKFRFFGLPGISILGGVSHNCGQMLVAIIALGTARITVLLPWLLLSGTVAGLAVGLLGAYLLPRLRRAGVLPGEKNAGLDEKTGSTSSVSPCPIPSPQGEDPETTEETKEE